MHGRLRPYAFALGCVLGGIALRAAFQWELKDSQVWLTFWPAAMVAAWFGGLRAGITAAVLSAVVVSLWLIRPHYDVFMTARHAIGAAVFFSCIIGIALGSRTFSRARESERRQRDAAEAARAEAQAANRAKDEFLAVLGHELRNPLAPIATASTLLRMRLPQAHELDVIDRQVGHMSRLVDDLLDVGRIVRGQIELQRSHVDIAAVVEKAAEMVAPLREKTMHQIVIDVPRGLIVHADAARLVQIVTNLLTNALKFSPAERPIRIEAARAGETISLRVIDRGAGIAPELLAHVFEPFRQLGQDSDRAVGGLGLGLTIARRLAELHGGTLTAKSEGTGKGTELELCLPASEASAIAAPLGKDIAAASAQRILVVDDNQDNAQLLADLLSASGHEVQVAFDGSAALELLPRFTPTFALLDIGLPGMDGHELARRMRERGIRAPLVALTGYGQESDREKALAAGFDEHLVKPVSLAKIQKLMASLTRPSA